MLSPLAKEKIAYVATIVALAAITAGCISVLAWMGFNFMRRLAG